MEEIVERSQEEFFKKFKRVIPHVEKGTSVSNNNIIHFTSFDKLQLILKNGFRPSFSDEFPIYQKEYKELEDILQIFNKKTEQVSNIEIPMCCFCDIPLKNISKHRKKYGNYGIALTKQWAISNHISPILYVAASSQMHFIIHSIYHLYRNAIKYEVDLHNDGFTINLFNTLEKFLTFVKPYINYETGYKYYDEREWRYVPPNFFSKEDLANSDNFLTFDAEDLACIFVTNAKEKKLILKLLITHFGSFDKKKIKVRK